MPRIPRGYAYHVSSIFNELTYLDGNKEWHSHGPQAFDGLALDNDYRDDAQSASVVYRNQLWNPFSVVFVLRAGARSDVSVAQPVVSFVSRAVRHETAGDFAIERHIRLNKNRRRFTACARRFGKAPRS